MVVAIIVVIIVVVAVDGKSFTKEQYFDELYNALEKTKIMLDKTNYIKSRVNLETYLKKYYFDERIIRKIKNDYNIRFNNVFLINSKKFYLISKLYLEKTNKYFIETAIYFIVLGCLLDALIDNGLEYQKREAKNKIDINYCNDYLINFNKAKENNAIDLLFEKVGEGLKQIKEIDESYYIEIIELIKRAIESELYVVSKCSLDNEKCMIQNKSILFSVISLKIALIGNKYDDDIFFSIGELFALIDDLCDYFEDKISLQKNIIISKIENEKYDFVINSTVNRLEELLEEIKNKTNKEIYNFFIFELFDWILGCPEINERIKQRKWQI